jgi:hypothetical protein
VRQVDFFGRWLELEKGARERQRVPAVRRAQSARLDSRFPERSGVVLGIDPKSSDDGLLQVREITRLRFHADLVTLSVPQRDAATRQTVSI